MPSLSVAVACLFGALASVACGAPASSETDETTDDALTGTAKADDPSTLEGALLTARQTLDLPAPGAETPGFITMAPFHTTSGSDGSAVCALRAGANVPVGTTIPQYGRLTVASVKVTSSGIVRLNTTSFVRVEGQTRYGIAVDQRIDIVIECKATTNDRSLSLAAPDVIALLSGLFETALLRTPTAIIGVRG